MFPKSTSSGKCKRICLISNVRICYVVCLFGGIRICGFVSCCYWQVLLNLWLNLTLRHPYSFWMPRRFIFIASNKSKFSNSYSTSRKASTACSCFIFWVSSPSQGKLDLANPNPFIQLFQLQPLRLLWNTEDVRAETRGKLGLLIFLPALFNIRFFSCLFFSQWGLLS